MNRVMLRPKTYQGDLDRWIDQLFTQEPVSGVRRAFQPAVNVLESEEAFRLDVIAPGLKKEEFDIEVEKGHLRIKAKRVVDVKDVKVLREEFGSYEIDRSFKLGNEVDADRVEATYENGILSLRIPKSPKALPRRIEIG